MGNCCEKNNQALLDNRTEKSKESLLTKEERREKLEKDVPEKICTKQEFAIWNELLDIGLVKLKNLNPKTQKIEFDYSEMDYHEATFFGQIIYMYDKMDNFLFFPQIFDCLIAIIDFIQVTLELKRKHSLKSFFLIYFNKFVFLKDKDSHKLKYICSKLNEPFNEPELLFKHDKIISSMSMYDSSKSFLNMMTQTSRITTNDEPDLNSYFYSKSKDLYSDLRNNNQFNFNEFEYFYSDIIMNFINRFMLKKTSISIKELNHDFTQIKKLLRSCFKELRKEKIGLQQLKEFLVSVIINNYDMRVLIHKMNKLLVNKETDQLYSQIMEYKRLDFKLQYGDCKTTSTKGHNFSFIYDKIMDKRKDPICIKCGWELIFKKVKKDEKMPLNELEDEIKKNKNLDLDFFYYLKYGCFILPVFSPANENSNNESQLEKVSIIRETLKKDYIDIFNKKKSEIRVSKKQEFSLIFELVFYDDEDRELFDSLGFDIKIKEILHGKSTRPDHSILYYSSHGLDESRNSNFRISNSKTDKDEEEEEESF
jgi:hypothetical protein